jgi:acyl-homoserine lactone acylase PvdQ
MLHRVRRHRLRCSHCHLLDNCVCNGRSASILSRLSAPFSFEPTPSRSAFTRCAGASLHGTVYIKGNTAPATVQTESNGFMHVMAATTVDVYRTLGFVSSKQRLLQMDFQRRVGRGNLSVFLGSNAAVPIDIYFRQLGWYSTPPFSRSNDACVC